MHHHRLLLLLVSLLIHASTFSAAGAGCDDRRCGSTVVPYPFGFSGDCPILLTCNATTSTAMLPHSNATAPYPIISFDATSSTFLASVTPTCNRTVRDAEASLTSSSSRRGAAGYGVSYRTGLFLHGGAACRPPPNGYNCSVPADLMTRLLRTQQCADGNNTAAAPLTCVSALPALALNSTAAVNGSQGQFVPWAMVNASGCQDALTTVLYGDMLQGAPSLQFSVAELGWWLNGTCTAASQCAAGATCHDFTTPSGTTGHQCACRDGMAGDGYAAGEGCYRSGNAGPKKKKKNIAVIVAGVLAGVTAIIGALFLCRLQRRRSAAGRYTSAMRLLSEAAASSGVPVYTYHEVSRATNGFSHTHRLGTGAYGTVYVGKLPAAGGAATLVAIKRLRRRHFEDDEDGGHAAASQLLNEIRLISSVRHPNLVRLLGCCLDRGDRHVLVYEYVPSGTLSHHLHVSEGPHLPWRARLVIAAETAAAIAHLHAARPAPIFHRDVKSTNILLDADLRPKLADFGLSRAACLVDSSRSHVSTAPQGTPGYVDPEYHQSFHLSDKSDVYSFGVVLLELVTAMKVVDFARPACEVNLASLAVDRIGKGRVAEIVDPAITGGGGEEWVMESVRRVSELAFRCLAFQKDVRPCMSEVAAELAWIRAAAPPGNEPGPGLQPTTGLQIDTNFDHSLGSAVLKKAASPVSVHETWVSDRSSPPSTNGSVVMPRC